MYFGCRKHDEDYIYRDEMNSMKDLGFISSLNCAFSREPNEEKVYVQDLLNKVPELIKSVLIE